MGGVAARGVICLPKRRTFARWVALAWSRQSLIRTLEEEAIGGLRLQGRVLDLGGHRKSGYQKRLIVDGGIETVNLDQGSRPDHFCDLEQPLPFADGSYDHVIAANTLEHIRRDVQLIGEAIRVLKPGGSFHFLVPFCHKVHGSPRDFHRHTAEWWLHTMLSYPCGDITVEPLVWDRRSSAVGFMKGGRLLRAFVMALPDTRAVASAMLAARRGGEVSQLILASRAEFALGYYVRGAKISDNHSAAQPSCL